MQWQNQNQSRVPHQRQEVHIERSRTSSAFTIFSLRVFFPVAKMSGVTTKEKEKTEKMDQPEKTVDSPRPPHDLQTDNDGLRKTVAGLKSKLFQNKRSKSQLQEGSLQLPSGLTSINDQQVKLLQKIKETEAENTKLRHLMAVGIYHRELELENLLAAERAHSRKLEMRLETAAEAGGPRTAQTSCLTSRQRKAKEVTKTCRVPARDRQRNVVALKLEEKVEQALLGLKAAQESQLRQKREATKILARLRAAEEDLGEERRRSRELQASLLDAEERCRQALREREQECLARLAQQCQSSDEKQHLAAAVASAEELLQSSSTEWMKEKTTLICTIESSRRALKDREQEHLDMESSLTRQLQELSGQMSRRRQSKWYLRLVPCCRGGS